MEPVIALVVLVVFGIPLALAVWLIVRAVNAKSRIEELTRRLGALEMEIFQLKRGREPVAPAKAAPEPRAEIITPPPVQPVEPIVTPLPVLSVPPPMAVPPPMTAATASPEPPPVFESPRELAPKINWEQFMGVKGFAWLGGLALFLGVAFFVKYSFDNNLVPPQLRVAIGFLAGLGPARGWRGAVAKKSPRTLANVVRDRRRHFICRYFCLPLDLPF